MAEGRTTRIKTCGQCGKGYEWRYGATLHRGHCSEDCLKARQAKKLADWHERNRQPRHCIGCGIEVGKKQHRCSPCSADHRKAYLQSRARARGVRPIEQAIADSRKDSVRYADLKCQGCGSGFVPKRTDRLKFCSKSCHVATTTKGAQIKREALHALKVETTALRLIRTGMPACLKRINQIRVWIDRSKAPCLACASPIGAKRAKVSTTAYCSSRCVQTQPHYTEFKRTARLKGKARKRAATVESVSPARVFERDGWICHLCGGKTLKDKRGTYHPKAPELDHIVPLSKGGEHSYRNTACAHRKCNAAKSDTIMGQPSLLAA